MNTAAIILGSALGVSFFIHLVVLILWVRDRLLIIELAAALRMSRECGKPCDECDGEGVVALGSGAQTYFGPCPKCRPE